MKVNGGGSAGAASPHDLLDGSVDQDTTATPVAAGAVIYGNSTPKWTALTAGSNNLPLVMTAGFPAWAALGPTGGGTGLTSYTTGDLIIASASNTLAKLAIGTTGQVLTVVAGVPAWSTAGTGTVTSVALSMPAIFIVSGSPITSSGTLAVTLATEAANTVWAGPTSGGAATPGFRSLVVADLPVVDAAHGGTGQSAYSIGDILYASGATTLSKLAIGSTGQALAVVAGVPTWTNAGSGTVTSVAVSASGSLLVVAGSPITTNGTIVLSPQSQSANLVFAGPTSGGVNTPTFRSLVDADMPIVGTAHGGTGAALTSLTTGSLISASGASTFAALAPGSANQYLQIVSSVPAWGALNASHISTGTLAAARLPAAGVVVDLTDAATIVIDASLSGVAGTWRVTVTDNGHTFGTPSNATDGQVMLLEVLSGAAYTIAFTSAYSGTLVALPTSTSGSSKPDTFTFVYRSAESKWFLISSTQAGSGSGSVTSVAMTVPAFLSVAGSPITSTGTLAVSLANQSANVVFAGPSSGGAAAPTFRSLVVADLPTVDAAHGGTGQTSYSVGDILYASGATTLSKLAVGSTGQVLTVSAGAPAWASAGSGTVTSVSLSMPAIFSVAGSPVTTSGTLAVTLANETANLVFAGPTTGSPDVPAFRALVVADLPTVTAAKGGTGQTSYTTGDVLYASGATAISKLGIGTTGQVLTVSGGLPAWASPATAGTVTSVALSMPSIFSVSGSPVTTSGTLAVTLATETANAIFAGPTTGSAATPTFRAMVVADLPTVDVAHGGTNITSYTSGDLLYATGATTLSKRGIGTTAQYLRVTAAAPTWSDLSATDISTGTLAAARLPAAGTVVNLTDGATISVDASLAGISGVWRITVTGDNHAFASPTNATDGQKMYMEMTSSIARPISWGAKYSGALITLPTTTTGGGAIDVLAFAYRSAEDLWYLEAASTNATGTGTVTSVAMTVPAFLSVSGSPVTTSGTLAITLATESANSVFAGPTSGGAATPSFRSLVAADLPTVDVAHGGTGQTSYSIGDILYASGTTTLSKLGIGANNEVLTVASGALDYILLTASNFSTQSANTVLAGPTSGGAATPSFRALVAADLPTVDVAHGGTGQTSYSTGDILYASGASTLSKLGIGATNQILAVVSGAPAWSNVGTGTVTSVGLSMPAIFSVAGTPVTTSGTLAVTLATQLANLVWAGPNTGSAAAPSFRTLVAADLPTVPIAQGGTGLTSFTAGDTVYYASGTALSKLAIGAASTVMVSTGSAPSWSLLSASNFNTQSANVVLAGPTSGGSATPTFRALVAADIPNLAASIITSGTLAVARGGTNLGSYTTGDLLYASGSTTIASLAVGTNGKFLIVASGLPAWHTLALADIPNLSSVVTLTDASTITVDASLFQSGNTIGRVTLGGNRTLQNPTNSTNGQILNFEIVQDATGSRTLSYDTKYAFTTDVPSPTLSTGANKHDFLSFRYNSTADKWYAQAVNLGGSN